MRLVDIFLTKELHVSCIQTMRDQKLPTIKVCMSMLAVIIENWNIKLIILSPPGCERLCMLAFGQNANCMVHGKPSYIVTRAVPKIIKALCMERANRDVKALLYIYSLLAESQQLRAEGSSTTYVSSSGRKTLVTIPELAGHRVWSFLYSQKLSLSENFFSQFTERSRN